MVGSLLATQCHRWDSVSFVAIFFLFLFTVDRNACPPKEAMGALCLVHEAGIRV